MSRPEPVQLPLLQAGQDLAELFHRTYERMGPDYGYGQGVPWSKLDDRYRQMLTNVFADMEMALRPGRTVTEVHAGHTVILLMDRDMDTASMERTGALIQSWLPGVDLRLVAGITGTLVFTPGTAPKEGHG